MAIFEQESKMTRIAKIALIGSEIDLVKLAIGDHIDLYYDEGQTLAGDRLINVKKKILTAAEKTARDQAKERQANLELT